MTSAGGSKGTNTDSYHKEIIVNWIGVWISV